MQADNNVVPVRFSRTNFFPKSASAAVADFLSLFYRYGYIYKPYGGSGWLSANDGWQLTDSELLKAIACVHPKCFIGTRASKAARYAVLDIDAGSKYHNLQSLRRITDLLSKAGIDHTNLYRSSESNGWHLYIFFDSPISSRDLREQLVQLFQLHDFEVAKGTLEIFPHLGNGSVGQGLRLPLQHGWAWLNQDNLVIREDRLDMSPVEALLTFLRDIESSSNSYHQFHQLKAFVARTATTRETIVARTANSSKLAQVIPLLNYAARDENETASNTVKSVFQKLPPGINSETWLKGRNYYHFGLTGVSQRADAIFCLSHYLFYGDPERLISPLGYGYEEERKWIINEVLKLKNHGFSKDIEAGRPEALKHVERAADWVPPHKRGQEIKRYAADVPVTWVKGNHNRSIQARKKIADAVAEFVTAGTSFSMRELRLKTGCSSDTLQKHADLWREQQNYRAYKSVRFASDPGEYNAGIGAASSESKPLFPVFQNDMPPGRLAARRIAYELGRKASADVRKSEQLKDLLEGFEDLWKESVNKSLPEEITKCGIKQLFSLNNLYSSLILQSPDYESERWLAQILQDVRQEIADRSQPPSPNNTA
ncbi:hypothetical protein BH10CYA1_BH10CYA1_62800 [soil metagenome]